MSRYIIMARWWNGHGWDMTRKEVKNKEAAIGAIKLLIKEVRPYQISFTDTEQDHGADKK